MSEGRAFSGKQRKYRSYVKGTTTRPGPAYAIRLRYQITLSNVHHYTACTKCIRGSCAYNYSTWSSRSKHWCAAHNVHVQTTITAAPSGNRNAEGSSGEHDISEVSKYSDRKSIIVLHKMQQIPETCSFAVCITALHCVHLHVGWLSV